MMLTAFTLVALSQTTFSDATLSNESPRNMMLEVKLGSYYPWVDRPLDCTPGSCPYERVLGGAMLLVEGAVERQLFQKHGSAALGASFGYAEKYGRAVAEDGSQTSEPTALRVLPMRIFATYRWDYAAIKWGVPLVPYVKAGFQLVHWWATKGAQTEVAGGGAGAGWSYGIVGTGGLAFQLDVLDRRLARDFDTGMGVNHTYLFAEFNIAEVNNFGARTSTGGPGALDLSARYFMFGLAFEY
ncbi:MAG: hypothetical protein JNK82_36335 [Myxococcaceae bacterium]|nr:hypothetical protein [Myxococcaceae bacterium]